MFYHDHAWGNHPAERVRGEAAGYLITDDTEQKLMAAGGPLASVGLGVPLVIQDKTFRAARHCDVQRGTSTASCPWELGYDATQMPATGWIRHGQEPLGRHGNFWFHHVYMPAQNPGDPSGMSAYGRWMYGPWFWPPAAQTKFGPIPNPY